MWSAQHYQKEVPMNMTGLVDVLSKASDTVFTVKFKKLATEDRAEELLKSVSYADLKN